MRFLEEVHGAVEVGIGVVNTWHPPKEGSVGTYPGCHDFGHGVKPILVLVVPEEVCEDPHSFCGDRKRLPTFFLHGCHEPVLLNLFQGTVY